MQIRIVLACPWLSLKMMVFALNAFCFELSIASSTVNLLYSPQALQNWSQSCRGSPTSCYVPGCRSKRANLARLRPNLTFFNDQQQQQKLQPALLASFLSLSYTRLWTCKVRTEENKNSLCYGGKSPKLYCNHPVLWVGVVAWKLKGLPGWSRALREGDDGRLQAGDEGRRIQQS